MKYTSFFSSVIRNSGVPQLNASQFRRMMNIVYFEGKIAGLDRAQNMNPELPRKYEMIKFKSQRKVTELTGNVEPSVLMKEMYQLSQLSF